MAIEQEKLSYESLPSGKLIHKSYIGILSDKKMSIFSRRSQYSVYHLLEHFPIV